MKNATIKVLLAGIFVLALAGLTVRADEDDVVVLRARMVGFEEATPTPNAGTGHGDFRATLSADGHTISYKLTWTGISGPPLFAHIHFAQRGVSGAVMAFLCGGNTKPACTQATSGTAMGTITATDIIAVASQGITAGNFTDFLRVIRAHDGYANLHTAKYPTGEIRGQVSVHGEDHDRD
jgi:hypothetical protein